MQFTKEKADEMRHFGLIKECLNYYRLCAKKALECLKHRRLLSVWF